MTANRREFVLTLSCPDTRGIVYAVSGVLYQGGCNILDSQQFGDRASGLFFMRVHFEAPAHLAERTQLALLFEHVRAQFGMQAQFHALAHKARVAILVSKIGHCLNDLLFRWGSGQLPVDLAAVVSNHDTFAGLAANHGVPFHHLPLAPGASAAAKAEQEARLWALLEAERVELVVLARYMQILSPALCAKLEGRAINIHHSFLPSF
ncbi:MAG: formyltetrahydrofolate deformylase, partial [Burkholderiaceae bacterium]|nr:formyltetrahydrofolate deformylase [Burkholderiaceae bacterium]